MLGVGGDGEQSFGSGLKQDGVDPSRVLQRQAADLLRKRENDVEVRNRQELGFPFGEPPGAGCGLALGAVAIATRVEYFDAMSAPVALIRAMVLSFLSMDLVDDHLDNWGVDSSIRPDILDRAPDVDLAHSRFGFAGGIHPRQPFSISGRRKSSPFARMASTAHEIKYNPKGE